MKGPEPPRIAELTVRRKERAFAVYCDRVAVDLSGDVYYVGIVAPAVAAKAFGAALNGRSAVWIEPKGLELFGGPSGKDRPSYSPGGLRPLECRYRRSVVRLGYDWVHAAWTAKDPHFLPCVEPESLWQALKRPEYTTPLLRGWLPHLTAELVRAQGLRYLWGQGTRCGKLVASVEQLDRIVSDGLRSGALTIPDGETARKEAV
jgi:hypothetical protein